MSGGADDNFESKKIINSVYRNWKLSQVPGTWGLTSPVAYPEIPPIDHITGNANRTLGNIRRNIKTKNPKGRETAYRLFALSWSIPPGFGTLILMIKHSRLRKSKEERLAGGPVTMIIVQVCQPCSIYHQLGRRSPAQRRADARHCLFYKIIHGLVTFPLPDNIKPTHRVSRYCHSMTFRQIHTGTNYYKYSFFPLAVVQWNALPEAAVSL